MIPKIAFDVIAKMACSCRKLYPWMKKQPEKIFMARAGFQPDTFIRQWSIQYPLQAIVSVRKLNKDVIAIFGLLRTKNLPCLHLQTLSKLQGVCPCTGSRIKSHCAQKTSPAVKISDYSNATLLPSHIYETKRQKKSGRLNFQSLFGLVSQQPRTWF